MVSPELISFLFFFLILQMGRSLAHNNDVETDIRCSDPDDEDDPDVETMDNVPHGFPPEPLDPSLPM